MSQDVRPGRGLGRTLIRALAIAGAGVVLLLAALVWTTVRLHDERVVRDARSSALVAGKTFAVAISSYDYQHLDRDFAQVTDHATGDLKAKFAKASKDLGPLIVKLQGRSTGTVVGAGVDDGATTDSATVVVFVDQVVRNTNSPQPRLDRNRLRIRLTHSSGAWLADRVDIL